MTQIRVAEQRPLTRYMRAVAQIVNGVPVDDLLERAKAADDTGAELLMVATAATLENRVLQGEPVEQVYMSNRLYPTPIEFREASQQSCVMLAHNTFDFMDTNME